jgi:hypothetical protein
MHRFEDMTNLNVAYIEEPTCIIERTPQLNINHSLRFENDYMRNTKVIGSQTDFLRKEKRDDYMQSTIKKDIAVKEWLLEDRRLNTFSSNVIEEIKSIFQSTTSVEAYSIELVKEELPGLPEDLTMYINLSKKVSKEEMMDLWKRISARSVETIRNLSNNQDEFEELLEKTTITLRRY